MIVGKEIWRQCHPHSFSILCLRYASPYDFSSQYLMPDVSCCPFTNTRTALVAMKVITKLLRWETFLEFTNLSTLPQWRTITLVISTLSQLIVMLPRSSMMISKLRSAINAANERKTIGNSHRFLVAWIAAAIWQCPCDLVHEVSEDVLDFLQGGGRWVFLWS